MKIELEAIQEMLESGIVNEDFEKSLLALINKLVSDDALTNLECMKLINALTKHSILFSLHLLSTSGNSLKDIEMMLIESYVTNLSRALKILKNLQ
jgi:hypothetical protein